MVRVWKPSGEERLEGVRGSAVHLRTGRQITFSQPERLIAFLSADGIADDHPAATTSSSAIVDQE